MALGKLSAGALMATAMAGLFLTLLTAGLLSSSQTILSTGTVTAVNVGVYSDSTCTLNLTSIDWGTLPPGNTTTKTVYVKNTGTVPVILTIGNSSWVPTNANTYLTLTWNRPNYVLNAGASVSAVLTLVASSSAGSITTFNFNVIVTGTQQ